MRWIVMMQLPADVIVSVEPTEEMAEEVASTLTDEDCAIVFPVDDWAYVGQWA